MPRLSDRIENVLNESRMLLLGGQVLLGFTYRICFEATFERLPHFAQMLELLAITVMTAGLCLLLWPAAFHPIAEHGWQTQRIHDFTTNVLDVALLPFCVGLGLTFYPVNLVLRIPYPAGVSIAVGSFAFVVWYGASWLGKKSHARERVRAELKEEEGRQDGDLGERIKKVLIECRMGLPGAQAFLGFQFAIVFTESFSRLPRSSQWMHFGSVVAITIAIVFLIAPAAYHRLAEAGEDSERFHTVASRLLLAGLAFLAPGMAADLYVLTEKITDSTSIGLTVSGTLLLACYALWFAFSFLRRAKQ